MQATAEERHVAVLRLSISIGPIDVSELARDPEPIREHEEDVRPIRA
jgi:hypothetical protein